MRLSPFRPVPYSMRPPEAGGKRERRGQHRAPRNTRNGRLPTAIMALWRAARVESRGEQRRSARRRRAMLETAREIAMGWVLLTVAAAAVAGAVAVLHGGGRACRHSETVTRS